MYMHRIVDLWPSPVEPHGFLWSASRVVCDIASAAARARMDHCC